jgi:transcriptional regulator with XRE-family HTH domain
MEILAVHLGVSHQQVQKWETGINRISALNLSQIASRLDCSANDLLGEAGAPGIASTQEGRLFPEGSSPEDGRLSWKPYGRFAA